MFFTVHFLLDAVEERGGEFEISYVFGWMLGTALIFQLLTFSNTCFFFLWAKLLKRRVIMAGKQQLGIFSNTFYLSVCLQFRHTN